MLKSKALLVRAVLAGACTLTVAALGCAAGGETVQGSSGAGGSGSGGSGSGAGGSSTTGGGGSTTTGAGGSSTTGGGGSTTTGSGGRGGSGGSSSTTSGSGGSGSGGSGSGAGGDSSGMGGSGDPTLPTGARIEYQCNDTYPGTFSSIGLHFQITNTMPHPINLSTFTIRYWFTSDGIPFTMQTISCEQIQPKPPLAEAMVKTTFHAVDPPRPNADSYIEIAFTPDAGGVGWMGMINQLDLRWTSMKNPGPMQSNDYSFDPSVTKYADYKKVTAYSNGTLVWGIEP
jgi:hypothetical protein